MRDSMFRKVSVIGIIVCIILIALPVASVTGNMNDEKTSIESNNNYIISKQLNKYSSFFKRSWIEQNKLTAVDGVADDWFGYSVSIDGDYAIIGAYCDDNHRGSAYVFKRSGTTWMEEVKLVASDGGTGDMFGFSVSISGDYAIIGVPLDDSEKGSAYVFKRSGTTWMEEDKLVASDGVDGDDFGFSVSIDGDYAVIGAHFDNGYKGSAYVFKRYGTTWVEEDKLVASDGEYWDFFGDSVSINGDYVVIGVPYDNSDKGSAYVFKRSGTTWIEEDKLVASDGGTGDMFGFSVSISGDYVVIGVPYDDSDKGSVYVFKRSGTTWIEEEKLVVSDGIAWDFFGFSVSIDGDYTIIGAVGHDVEKGAAYIFKRSGTTWTEEDKLSASDGEAYDLFGYSVSIDGKYAVIGAPQDDSFKGSAYMFINGSENQPPSAPTITGPDGGKAGTEYDFTFNVVDPDEDDVRYLIDWGDTNTETTDFETSGINVIVSHTWAEEGTYTITAYAEDEIGLIGPEATKLVNMPRGKAINTPFLNWLQSHPNIFPILQRLLLRLGLQ